jgi:N-sulfoglucosamine sulfohydrolase
MIRTARVESVSSHRRPLHLPDPHIPAGFLVAVLSTLVTCEPVRADELTCNSEITAAGQQTTDATPNILLITSEDNGPELSCYGDPFVQTPHLDRLAAEGVRFERAFVTTASCSESRSSILTGLYPHQNGQIGLATHRYRMYGRVPNLASFLKGRGYRTGLIGKLHVNPEGAFPFDFRPRVAECNTFQRRDVNRVAEMADDFFSSSDAPFFLMVNYADAHLPFLRSQHGLPESPITAKEVHALPWIGLDTPGLRQSQADYYNCVARLDTGIGMLLDALDRAGLARKTLVIYLGDHGAQFPRGKLASYECSLRVPLLMRWPGHVPAAKVHRELVSTVDLVPTILEAAGTNSGSHLPGRSLLALVQGGQLQWREYLCCEYHGHYPPLYFPQRTVRDDRYKLILNLLQDRSNPVAAVCTASAQPSYVSAADVAAASQSVREAYRTWSDAPPIELYDLATDPHEMRNRADDPQLSSVKTRLIDQLRLWQDRTADPLADPEKLAKLTAEHDAIPKPYRRRKDFTWKYQDYLSPNKSVEKTPSPSNQPR